MIGWMNKLMKRKEVTVTRAEYRKKNDVHKKIERKIRRKVTKKNNYKIIKRNKDN